MNDLVGTSATKESRQRSRLDMAVSRDESNVAGPGRAHALSTRAEVALLTGGGDKPYALGMAFALSANGVPIDFIGSDDLDVPELRHIASLNFLNLRGNNRTDVSPLRKVIRVLAYYLRLVRYAATAKPKIFHILWNNKFAVLDRTLIMLYYRVLGKRIVLTAHNVNAGERDGNDSFVNRLTLRIQYLLADHIFVHTEKMRMKLRIDFGVADVKSSVIPLGINNTVPNTTLSATEARQRLGLVGSHKVGLFFGRIAPYKGLEYLLDALALLAPSGADYRLIIAGQPKDCEAYWKAIRLRLSNPELRARVVESIEFVPDVDTEIYFKAADVLMLPYVQIFQSGVLSLGYSFGLPVIASDVGSFAEDIIEGETGFICKPGDSVALAKTIEAYFSSKLYRELSKRRRQIQNFANERFSWTKVGDTTRAVYMKLLAQ
jgi:glycosyltransferase involved in cell wall biosynthesis